MQFILILMSCVLLCIRSTLGGTSTNKTTYQSKSTSEDGEQNKTEIVTQSPSMAPTKDISAYEKDIKVYEKSKPVHWPPKCPQKTSCVGRCSFKREYQDPRASPYPSCFCDPQCNTVFDDCCADYDQVCNATLMDEKYPPSELDRRWGCNSVDDTLLDLWMIHRCSPDWKKDEISRKCSSKDDDGVSRISLKVPVIDENNVTYRNRYCALCNGVKEFTHWKFKVPCDVTPPRGYTETEWSAFLDYFCNYPSSLAFASNTRGKRLCYNVIGYCKYKDDDVTVKNCLEGPTGLISLSPGANYRNWDCVLCQFPTTSVKSPPGNCGPDLTLKLAFRPVSFSKVFTGSGFDPETRSSRCPLGHVFDQVSHVCRQPLEKQRFDRRHVLQKYFVILQYDQEGDSCSVSLKIAGSQSSRFRFGDVFERLLDITLIERGWKFHDLNIDILGNSGYRVTFQVLREVGNESSDSEVPLQYSKLDNITFESFLPYDLPMIFRVCRYTLTHSAVRKMFCIENDTYALNEVKFFKNETIFINKTKEHYNEDEYFVYEQENNERRLAVCKNSVPANCSYYFHVKNETHWRVFPNRSIYTNVTASWYNYGEYSIINGTLWLCLDEGFLVNNEKFQRNPGSVHDDVLSYATLVGFTLSIVSLVVLLTVYFMFPSLRNLPGKNLMLLSATLALGQLLWLLQTEVKSRSSTLCAGLSIALQYFFLASFCCSGSFAFHSFITFRAIAKGKLRQPSSGKAFLWYGMYSLGFPLVLVVICWLLDYQGVVSIEYGGRGHCWFGSKVSLYIGFVGPMFTLLFLNFLLLLTTLRMIHKCTRESQKMAEDNGGPTKTHVGIYVRMSTLMGFTWLFGLFLLIFPDILAFEYLFVFINSLQGLYIAVAFLFTDSVKKLLSKKFSGSDYTSNTMSTTARQTVG